MHRTNSKGLIMNNHKSNLIYQILSILLLALIFCMFTGMCCKRSIGTICINKYIDNHYPTAQTQTAKTAPVVTAEPVSATKDNDHISHTVARGETLFDIAHSYTGDGYGFRQIAQYNNIDPNAVEVGDMIKIPVSMIK